MRNLAKCQFPCESLRSIDRHGSRERSRHHLSLGWATMSADVGYSQYEVFGRAKARGLTLLTAIVFRRASPTCSSLGNHWKASCNATLDFSRHSVTVVVCDRRRIDNNGALVQARKSGVNTFASPFG